MPRSSLGSETRPPFSPTTEDRPFLRLWHGFLTGRVMVALALLLLQAIAQIWSQQVNPWMLGLPLAYLLATLLLRVLGRHAPPAPHAGPQWLPSIGVDLLAIGLLQWLHTGGMNFTALLGLPILMAAVLGTLMLAWGTTAAATLLLLGWAWWQGEQSGADPASRYLQAALTGTGYFIVAFLVHQLATRLVRENQVAQHNRRAAQMQRQVSTLVMENLNDGVLVLDEAHNVRMLNPAALRLLSHAPASLWPPFSLLEQTAWQPLCQLAQRTFDQGLPQTADVTLLWPGHSPVGLHVRCWLTPLQATSRADNEERLCVMFLHDLRELEARLRTEKLAAMGRMSAAVAHEIRNPLAAIVQANALLDEELHDPVQKRLAQMVQQNAERLTRIAEEVLDIARVQSQIAQVQANTLALDDTVAQIWHDWQAHEPARRIGVLALQADNALVEFEAEHLRRVLVNLLDNALRYMSPAADALQLLTRSHAAGQLSVQVWSDGARLDQSVERHLFEPFFSSESRSSGLGLYICRELCERYGASISYQRLQRPTERGLIEGNAFTIHFRKPARKERTATLFDNTPVV